MPPVAALLSDLSGFANSGPPISPYALARQHFFRKPPVRSAAHLLEQYDWRWTMLRTIMTSDVGSHASPGRSILRIIAAVILIGLAFFAARPAAAASCESLLTMELPEGAITSAASVPGTWFTA